MRPLTGRGLALYLGATPYFVHRSGTMSLDRPLTMAQRSNHQAAPLRSSGNALHCLPNRSGAAQTPDLAASDYYTQ